MARGGKRGHKGGRRQFTNPQALEQQKLKKEKEEAWRKQRGEEVSDDEEKDSDEEKEEDEDSSSGEEGEEGEETSSEEEEDEEEDLGPRRSNGTSGLITIENPNRIVQKQKKVTDLDTDADGAPQLSRREREEIQKQRAKECYDKLHREGKTDEARADLARLAIVRKQREEAAKKREEEKKSKDQATTQKKDSTAKALGKRR